MFTLARVGRHSLIQTMFIPALLIRTLLPDLNPLILAGVGVAVYSAYLAVMIAALWRQDAQAQSAAKVAPAAIEMR